MKKNKNVVILFLTKIRCRLFLKRELIEVTTKQKIESVQFIEGPTSTMISIKAEIEISGNTKGKKKRIKAAIINALSEIPPIS